MTDSRPHKKRPARKKRAARKKTPLAKPKRRVIMTEDSSGGEPPDMEQRIQKIEQTLAVIESNYATSDDLHRELNSQTWKVVGFVLGAMALMTGAYAAIVNWLIA